MEASDARSPTDWNYDTETLSQYQITWRDQVDMLGHLAGTFTFKEQSEQMPEGRFVYRYHAHRFVITALPGYDITWAHAKHCVAMMQTYYTHNYTAILPGLIVRIYDMVYLAGMCQLGDDDLRLPECARGRRIEVHQAG